MQLLPKPWSPDSSKPKQALFGGYFWDVINFPVLTVYFLPLACHTYWESYVTNDNLGYLEPILMHSLTHQIFANTVQLSWTRDLTFVVISFGNYFWHWIWNVVLDFSVLKNNREWRMGTVIYFRIHWEDSVKGHIITNHKGWKKPQDSCWQV